MLVCESRGASRRSASTEARRWSSVKLCVECVDAGRATGGLRGAPGSGLLVMRAAVSAVYGKHFGIRLTSWADDGTDCQRCRLILRSECRVRVSPKHPVLLKAGPT